MASNAWTGRGNTRGRGRGQQNGGRGGRGGGNYPPLGPQAPAGNNLAGQMGNMAISQGSGGGAWRGGGGGGGQDRGQRPPSQGNAWGGSQESAPPTQRQPQQARGGDNGGDGATSTSSGSGRRGGRRIPTIAERLDFVNTRPAEVVSKRGEGGTPTDLVANFFVLSKKRPNWVLYNHRVDFFNAAEDGIEEKRTFVKKKLLAQQGANFGLHIFDGSNLYTICRLAENMTLASQREDGVRFEIKIAFVGQVHPADTTYLQFFNIIMRKCLSLLQFKQIGRHFYDADSQIRDLERQDGLILIPGVITTLRQHEQDIMMCVEITHKVIRTTSCLDILKNNDEKKAREILISSVVLTRYNNKTYRVDDILYDKTPNEKFSYNGSSISLADYYKQKYNLRVTSSAQPIIFSKPRRQDFHRGEGSQSILLIPEFCTITGLLDHERSDYNKMRRLAEYLQQRPNVRVGSIKRFVTRLRTNDETRKLLADWELGFDSNSLVSIDRGRVLPPHALGFRALNNLNGPITPTQIPPDRRTQLPTGDWTNFLRTDSKFAMASCPTLETNSWVIISPRSESQTVNNVLVPMMIDVGKGMGFPVAAPIEVFVLNDNRPGPRSYCQALQDVKNKHRQLVLIWTILPNVRDNTVLYNAIKRMCLSEFGILNQCFRGNHLMPDKGAKLMSVVTKVMVQINAKLGGEPWKSRLDFKVPTMIAGFDVYHPGRQGFREGGKRSIGATVATMNSFASKFYSVFSPHQTMVEISERLHTDIISCVQAFANQPHNRQTLPKNIIIFRDGVGEGQLNHVHSTEVRQMKEALKVFYEKIMLEPPKLLFIVVTKKGNARILSRVRSGQEDYQNPMPGTVVDTTITLPERYDFFLIPQKGKEGQTVTPTAFNVLHDEIGIPPSKVQNLAYQLCHMYFNWSGTVGVPAVCQYAHKLAYLVGTALNEQGNTALVKQNLTDTLYYL